MHHHRQRADKHLLKMHIRSTGGRSGSCSRRTGLRASAHPLYDSAAGYERDREKYRDIRAEKEEAIRAQDYEKAAALRDCELHTKDELERILNGWREQRDEREVIPQPTPNAFWAALGSRLSSLN
jgi:UvrB/uvrC motif